MKEDKRSFLLYTELRDTVNLLDDMATRGELFTAILDYANDGECEPLEDKAAQVILVQTMAAIRYATIKWFDKRRTNQLNVISRYKKEGKIDEIQYKIKVGAINDEYKDAVLKWTGDGIREITEEPLERIPVKQTGAEPIKERNETFMELEEDNPDDLPFH